MCALAGLKAAELQPETVAAFDRYVKLTEDGFAANKGFNNFLWVDHHPKDKSLVWLGQSVIRPMQTLDHGKEIEVPGAVLQHWLGSVYLESSNANIDNARGLLMNLAGYKDFFKEQIIESKVKKREGDNYEYFLRFYKKQFSTVVLNVDETGKYTLVDPLTWSFASHSTRIGEAEHPKNKKKLDEDRPAEDGAGYLWRFNLYIRARQADDGVYVEMEMITLSREATGFINPSRFLTGFQNFPHDLMEYIMDTLQNIFPHRK